MGWSVALLVSLEVIRSWMPHGEPFAVDARVIRDLSRSESAVARAGIEAESAAERAEDSRSHEKERAEMESDQLAIQKNFVDIAIKNVESLRRSVETKNGNTERALDALRGKIDAVKKAKLSRSEFESLAEQIRDEIAEAQTIAAGRDTAFLAAMNKTLEAEDIQQYQVIRDIEQAYATKAEGVEIEKMITDLSALSRETQASLDGNTGKLLQKLDSLAALDRSMADFEAKNLLLPSGEMAKKGFVDELTTIKNETAERVASLEKTADALVRCEAQTGLRDRVAKLEGDAQTARDECESSLAVCERALGRDPIFLKPDSHLLLGDTGKSLVMHGNSLKICDAPDENGVGTNCRTLDASVSS